MLHRIYLLFFLTIMQTLALGDAQVSLNTCVEATNKKRSVQLNCNGGFISNVSVESGTGECLQQDGHCFGKTPSLMVDYMNCYWRKDCTIKWPHDRIIFSESSGENCIGRQPTFMAVSYKCFKPTDFQEDFGYTKTSESGTEPKTLLIDICSNLESGHGTRSNYESCYERSGSSGTAGIIRSHKLYPWDYPSTPRNCSIRLYWPKGQKLVIAVHNVDINDDDSLLIVNNDKAVNASSEKTFQFTNGHETSFVFNVGTESNSGKGFLLCFKFVSKDDQSVHDACEKIMGPGNVSPVIKDVDPLDIYASNTMLTDALLEPRNPESTTLNPTTTTEQIPRKCLKKKPGKKRDRCIKKHKNKQRKPKKKRRRGRKEKRKRNLDKGRKDTTPRNRRRRRHGIRRHGRKRAL